MNWKKIIVTGMKVVSYVVKSVLGAYLICLTLIGPSWVVRDITGSRELSLLVFFGQICFLGYLGNRLLSTK